MKWGVCTTALAPLQQILAFVAWHKHIGATHIWVHLDDADAVSGQLLNQIDGVTAVLCDAQYWTGKGYRPKTQEARQSYNIQRVCGLAELPVIAHVDVDEYLYPKRPIADILDDWTDDAPYLRCVPAEALHDPALPDDIFTACQFRLPFPNGLSIERRYAVLGDYTLMLKKNMLSHKVGKALFRTGLDGFVPRLHAGTFGKDGPRIDLPLHPDLMVLHFHAQDRTTWRAALDHRVSKGAYRFNEELAGYLGAASEAEIDAFYEATQMASPELIAALDAEGLLVEADLKLKDKVAELF
ncbi:MAG: glycosyltransferase family 2 protein [Octadecabacter sp.]